MALNIGFECQCPLGLLPHFYPSEIVAIIISLADVSMPSRAVTSFLLPDSERRFITTVCVSMPSRAVTSFLPHYECDTYAGTTLCVNALSGCYLISTHMSFVNFSNHDSIVSMPSRAVTSFLPVSDSIETAVEVAMCQCPLGLLPHFYRVDISTRETCIKYCVNALSGCYLISTRC